MLRKLTGTNCVKEKLSMLSLIGVLFLTFQQHMCTEKKNFTYWVVGIVLDDILYLAIGTIIYVCGTIASGESCKDGGSNWS